MRWRKLRRSLRIGLAWLAGWLGVLCVAWSEEAQGLVARGEGVLSLEVVPPKVAGAGGVPEIRFRSEKQAPCFHVVLTNVSEHTARLWETWNSWGFYNLTFELTDAEGKRRTVERWCAGWSRNFASWFLLKPGERYVFDIWFPGEWRGLPEVKGKAQEVSLRAVYAIPEDDSARTVGVWSGTVRSAEVKVRLWEAPR